MDISLLRALFICLCCVIISLSSGVKGAMAFQQPDSAITDTQYVNNLLSESLDDINHGSFTEARNKIDLAMQLSDSLDFTSGKTLAIVRLTDLFLSQQKNDSVIVILEDAIEEYPDSPRMVNFYNFLATAYHYKGEENTALDLYRKALEFIPYMTEDEQAKTTAAIRHNMAGVFINLGNKNEAFENYLLALRFSEMTRDTVFLVTTLNNIGTAYNNVENYEEAEYYLKKGRELAESENLKIELYRIYLNLANTNSNQEDFEEAQELYDKALDLHSEIRPNSPPVVILYNLGRLQTSLRNFEKAQEFLDQSLAISAENNILPGLYYNNLGLGNLYFEQNRHEEAILHLNRAYKVASDVQNIPFLQESRELLYKTYQDAGQYQNALIMLEEHTATADSLFTQEKEQALAMLENQLALDRQNEINRLLQEKQVQQERRIHFQYSLIIAGIIVLILILIILALMKKRAKEKEEINKQLQKQKEALEEANKAKDRLFTIVAHDLRSPLSSLQGILYLIKNKALTKDDVVDLARELEVSVQQNIDAMEDILAWAKDQLSGDTLNIEKVNLKILAEQVLTKQSFMAKGKGVELINDVEENCKVLADANALELVLRNLISNSIKFTNSGDSISIGCEENSDNILLKVKDTGIGIPEDAKHKVFESKTWTRKGTSNEKGTGFGLNLCKEFVERMNGSMHFESEENAGTTFFVELPKSQN